MSDINIDTATSLVYVMYSITYNLENAPDGKATLLLARVVSYRQFVLYTMEF